MVYFQPQSDDITFATQALDINRRRPVEVFYNGSGLHQIAGPVPVVDISTSANRNSAGTIESFTTKINIDGKIVRTGIDGDILQNGTGIGPVLSGINEFKTLFNKELQDFGVLEIKCGVTNTIYVASGVKILDLSFNKSDDNWIYTADYNIGMEFEEPSNGNQNLPAKNTSDNWTIEPIEDYVYCDFLLDVKSKGEIHNPQMVPEAPSEDNPIPGVYGSSGSIGQGSKLRVANIPQYRVSRRVSAVGIPTGSGNAAANSAYQNAKLWVEDRLRKTYTISGNPPQPSGFPYFNFLSLSGQSNPDNIIHLYNHLRTHNFSVSDGTYEVNDTWLAMPSGIGYVEDYTVECSSDDRFVKTVRVQGQIKGLSTHNINSLVGSNYNPPDASGIIGLSGSLYEQGDFQTIHVVPDVTPNTVSKDTILAVSKFQNAKDGWLYDIKPYLYRRACAFMNSADRDRDYINKYDPNKKPGNPFYSKESLLNINPVSTTEGYDPKKGTISYSAEFNNKLTLLSGVISENISVNETGPTDVFGETFVIGRQLGPVLQSLNASTSTRKDVTIDITVMPPSSIRGALMTEKECPLYIYGSLYQQMETLIEALRPFGEHNQSLFGNQGGARNRQDGQVYKSQDNHNWSPADGRYSRSVSWTYQQCSNYKTYLDH